MKMMNNLLDATMALGLTQTKSNEMKTEIKYKVAQMAIGAAIDLVVYAAKKKMK